MYYSKNGGNTINIPRNYSGNTFRVIDETERSRTPTKELATPINIADGESNFDKNNQIDYKFIQFDNQFHNFDYKAFLAELH